MVEKALKKAKEGRQDCWVGLPNSRATPSEDMHARQRNYCSEGEAEINPYRLEYPSVAMRVKTNVPTERSRGPLPPLVDDEVISVNMKLWAMNANLISQTNTRSYTV